MSLSFEDRQAEFFTRLSDDIMSEAMQVSMGEIRPSERLKKALSDFGLADTLEPVDVQAASN